MSAIAGAAAIMAVQGLLFATILAIAYRFLRVEEDPRIDVVEGLLPGSNCGACGEPGCRAFAEKVVGGTHSPSACTVSSPGGLEAIADYLGVDAGEQAPPVARLKCAGGEAQAPWLAAYEGIESCRAAHLVGGGGKGCSWGCLGLADCAIACTFDAIRMNAQGLPVVDPERCTGCNDCVEVCPRDLFVLLPRDTHLFVQCNLPLAGEAARALCRVACDACGLCAADAAPGLVRMENNLPVIDVAAGGAQSPEATRRCPTGAIQWIEDAQFTERIPARRRRVVAG